MAATNSGSPPYGSRCQGPDNPYEVFEPAEIEQSIGARFEAQAAKRPSAIAIKDGERTLTYGELNAAANRVARALIAAAPADGDGVVLLFDDPALAIGAMLGVLKAGRFYVPLNPAHPPARLAAIFENSRAGAIITSDRSAELARGLGGQSAPIISIDRLGGELPGDNLPSPVSPDALAYIIYTSGSTGVPKGVVQVHRNVLHNVMKYTNAGHICPADRHVLLHTYDVGASVSSIYGALLNGASLYPFDVRERGFGAMAAWIEQEQITVYHSVPVIFRYFLSSLREGVALPSIRYIKLSGEAATRHDLELFRRHFSTAAILCVGLGATEMNIIRGFFADTDTQIDGPIVPVGYEVADTEVVILDAAGREQGGGEAGEIAIRSRYLFRGYWQQPELTAAVLTEWPDGRRQFRTGDRGMMLPGGCLLHLGRRDSFTKIRGYRVETGEVEAALFELPSVTDAAVVAREDQPGEAHLVAYVVQDKAAARKPAELRAALVGKLPDFAVPSVFVESDAIPRTPNGKVDRLMLPAPSTTQRAGSDTMLAPRTGAEKIMAGIWADVLGTPAIGVRDDFLSAGGHSLLGARLLLRVEEVFGVSLPLRALFENPTVEKLCQRLEEAAITAPPPTIRGVSRALPHPLSYAQEQIWRASNTELGRLGYNSTTPFAIRGPLDVAALESALEQVVDRHEVLRTNITTVGGEPMQSIRNDGSFELATFDTGSDRAVVQTIYNAELARPFDLERDLPIRATLVKTGAGAEHLLLLTLHHIAFDALSKKLLFAEIGTFYDAARRSEAAGLTELGFHYVDYAVWERERLDRGGSAYRGAMEYWMSALVPTPPVIELPFLRPEPAATDLSGALQVSEIDEALMDRLRDLTRAKGATLFMTLIAAFMAALNRATGLEDLTIGVYVSTRTLAVLDPIVGYFINLVAFRAGLENDPSFAELLRRIRNRTLEVFAHREIPWADVVTELHRRGAPPQLTVIFQYMDVERAELRLAGLEVERLEPPTAAMPWGLEVDLSPQGRKLLARTSVNTDRYDPAGVANLLQLYREILEAVAADPRLRLSQLPGMKDNRWMGGRKK
jgi:amino acid adenylation domain-containing protein